MRAQTAPDTLQASLWNKGPVTAPRRAERIPLELGVRFTADRNGEIAGIRFYKPRGERGAHVGTLWDARGRALARVRFTGETREGWQTALFGTPVPVWAGAVYTASYHTRHGAYVAQRGGFSQPVVSGPLSAPSDRNGVFAYGKRSRFPSYANPAKFNYFTDVIFNYRPSPGPTPTPTGKPTPTPTVTATPTTTPTRPTATPTTTPTKPTGTPTTTPTKPTTTPTQPTSTPTKPTTTPTQPTSTPTRPTSTPTKPTSTPTKPTSTPTKPTSTPTKPTSTPTKPTDPPMAGFPNEGNTGPTISTFKKIKGGEVKQDGAVFDGVEVSEGFDIWADNVTIRNCKIIVGGYWGIQLRAGHTNLTVENCEIGSNKKTKLDIGIWNDGTGDMTVRRNNIHTTSNAAIMAKSGLIEDNYIHDMWQANPGDHTDGIQTNGNKEKNKLVIRHNTIINPENQTSAIILSPVFGPIHDVEVTGNLLAGGGYCIYGGAKHIEHPFSPYNVVIKDNVFSRQVFSKCGYYGPMAHFDSKAEGNLWSNNRWEDGGQAVGPG
ncbi:DUF4082 domain-containing protein [Nonomuraea endophytica]|uniref:DUF4082 domain-containing protein n=1 Tax=Nonomuraea endophytica TaxID=714136 RepID=UPI0037C96527